MHVGHRVGARMAPMADTVMAETAEKAGGSKGLPGWQRRCSGKGRASHGEVLLMAGEEWYCGMSVGQAGEVHTTDDEGKMPQWVRGLDDGDRRAWVASRAARGHDGARRRRRHGMVMIST